MSKKLIGAAVGLGMLAETFTGCTGAGGYDRDAIQASTTTTTTIPEVGMTAPDASVLERKQAAIAMVDVPIACIENDGYFSDDLNQTNFGSEAASARYGLDLGDAMFGFQAVYTPPSDTQNGSLKLSPFQYDFTRSDTPTVAPEDQDLVFDTSIISKELQVYDIPAILGSDGYAYSLYLVINKPEKIDVSLNVACVRTPIGTLNNEGSVAYN